MSQGAGVARLRVCDVGAAAVQPYIQEVQLRDCGQKRRSVCRGWLGPDRGRQLPPAATAALGLCKGCKLCQHLNKSNRPSLDESTRLFSIR